MPNEPPHLQPDPALAEALRLLGKDRLVLAVHDASFPGLAGEDGGRGSPYGAAAEALARFARGQGFTGLQLGPQGQTSAVNPSPYDGTLFSRNILSLDLKTLVEEGLLSRRTWDDIVAGNPRPDGLRVAYGHALAAWRRAVDEMHGRAGDIAPLEAFWHDTAWLRDDALYEALCLEHGGLPWRHWPHDHPGALDRVLCAPPAGTEAACSARRQALEERHAPVLERYALAQWLLLQQHRDFRSRMAAVGLKVYGDVQIGFSQQDQWSRQGLLLAGYRLGAPPSRTTPAGQPWGYQVLDPAQYLGGSGRPGPVLRFFAERLGKLLGEFDGLRLDHPHGLVCPWVYRADDPDPWHAVQHGARLFAAPDLPDHVDLARYAIARPEQLDRERPRYADDWERELTAEQEDRYALVMDTLMEQVRAHGRDKADILCEVLSTEPLPLRRVRRRHGLGRFRVTQKADLDDPVDGYRGENAEPEDWVMVGNHDTPSIWRLARSWEGTPEGGRQAGYLAGRLGLADPGPVAADRRRLAHAKVAELFLSPARNVMVFFADLFGLEATYNTPGTVSEDNWTLRIPPDFAARHRRDRLAGEALNLHAALALALRARPEMGRDDLVARLDQLAGWRVEG
jgi:4-alpha-glucanotransferase